MTNTRILRVLAILIVLQLWTASCGGGGRELISISVSPATANGALGGVQFTATGTFN